MGEVIIREAHEGERRWFFGGGEHVWKARAEDTNGAFFLVEDNLARGKTTPWHQHPDHDELVYVLEGEILYRGEREQRVGPGAIILTPRGVPHAFVVISEHARFLFLQAPGSAESFYRTASEPAGASERKVDFGKIREAAASTGVTVVLGPPPFGKP